MAQPIVNCRDRRSPGLLAERPETYADIGLPIYTSDGKRMAFAAKAEKKWTLVVDGTPLKAEFDDIVTRTFSPDGSRAAYVGRRGNKFVVVVDGKERPPADVVSAIRFSADGRRFAYANANVDRGFGRQKALGRVTIDEGVGPTHEGAQVGSLMRSMATGSYRLPSLPFATTNATVRDWSANPPTT